jgi:hypothetical protein
MRKDSICETSSLLYNKDGIVMTAVAIPPRHVKGMELRKRGTAHPGHAEIDELTSLALPTS